jgi:autotransporter-associated beta strand protein
MRNLHLAARQLLLLLILAIGAQAATATWTGNAGNGLVSDALNWTTAPATGDTLEFPNGATGQDVVVDTSTVYGAMVFKASGYVVHQAGNVSDAIYTTFSGGSLQLDGITVPTGLGPTIFASDPATTIACGAIDIADGAQLNLEECVPLADSVSGAGTLYLNQVVLTLDKANTISGSIVVENATLRLTAHWAAGTATIVTADDGTVHLDGGAPLGAVNINNPISINRPSVAAPIVSDAGNNAIAGPITLIDSDLGIEVNGESLTLQAPISGAYGFTKLGPGTMVMQSANTYDGQTTVVQGFLDLAAITGPSIPGDLILSNGTARDIFYAGQFTASANITVAAGSNLYLGQPETVRLVCGDGTLALSGQGELTHGNADINSFGGPITGANHAIHWTGPGTWIASGTADGIDFHADGGALDIDGPASGCSASVDGGILAGTGSLGPIAATSGTLHPGYIQFTGGPGPVLALELIGVLACSSVSLAPGSTLAITSAANATSRLDVLTGPIAYGGAQLDISGRRFGDPATLVGNLGGAIPTGTLVSSHLLNYAAGTGHDLAAVDVEVEVAAGQADPAPGGPVDFTVRFDAPATGFTPASLVLGGTANPASAAISGGGPVYTVTVSGMDRPGTVTLEVAAGGATDAGGNPCLASFSIDHQVTLTASQPSVALALAAGQSDPAVASPILVTASFSSPVTGFDASDIVLGGTALADTAVVSGGPSLYTIRISGMSGPGTVDVSIPAAAAHDASTGFASTAAPALSASYSGAESNNHMCGMGGAGVLLALGLALTGMRRR